MSSEEATSQSKRHAKVCTHSPVSSSLKKVQESNKKKRTEEKNYLVQNILLAADYKDDHEMR